MTALILIHPAVAVDPEATQALADRLGMVPTVEIGYPATLEPVHVPARIPAPSSWTGHRAIRPGQGGDAA